MAINPVEKQNAGGARDLYDTLEKNMGRVLNFFGVMANKPEVLNTFVPFYQAVWAEGDLPAKLKELAYLRTSILNGCEY